jgi:tRNA pseudouridine38-40 synthase
LVLGLGQKPKDRSPKTFGNHQFVVEIRTDCCDNIEFAKTFCAPEPVMRTLKLTIAYDGTDYAGWQFQPDKPTVQATLEDAIAKVTGQRVRVLASGRTDAGVHAMGQVVGFRTNSSLPPEVLLRALNANLPPDVAVLDAAEAAADFHAIAHVVRKRYRYVIHDGPVRDVFSRRYAWHYNYGRLDAAAMQRAAAALVGTHDFSSFESSGAQRQTSVRTIFELLVERGRAGQGGEEGLGIRDWGLEETPRDCGRGGASFSRRVHDDRAEDPFSRRVHAAPQGRAGDSNLPSPIGRGAGGEGRAGDYDFLPHAERQQYIVIEIEADGFLYNMVRAIVGTLVRVGRGVQAESWPGEVMLAVDRRLAGPTAPPQGLCLVWVEYG